MLSSQLLLSLVFVPSLVSAGVFPPDSLVKMLDAKSFKKAMKANQTSMVAFVAPWCGHCQRMAPEYSKAALGLHPLLPLYAVDCDADKNKGLCSEQGVQGFPTIKLFPRGKEVPPMLYDSGERSASAFYYFATRRIPTAFTKLYHTEDIIPWIEKTVDKTRTLLLTKDKKVPLLWKVLANKYQGQLEFGTHRDRKGKSSVAMGFEAGEKKESKVLLYSAGSTTPFRYEGINKLDSLSKFLDSVIDGSADLTVINEEAKAEEFEPSDEELEIQRKQEAQRIALLHGGFSDLIDFEKALMDADAANYHDTNGFGSPPPLKAKSKEAKVVPEEGAEQVPMQATPAPGAESPAATSSHQCSASADGECASTHVGKNEAEL
ncbi:thioredoxin-like protein [Mycena sp. CBHHK59/15]|nr:thioredoxin-like protein [Mycena sp. CBHHK59/15]